MSEKGDKSKVLLFDYSDGFNLTQVMRKDLKENEKNYLIGHVSKCANKVAFWHEGLMLCAFPFKAQGYRTRLGKLLGQCNDIHLRMREGQEVPPPEKRIKLRSE